MYKGRTVSLVLPAYNEEESIVRVIQEFKKTWLLDEVIIVDNNCKDNTVKLARGVKNVKIVKERKQGYGYALQRGLAVSKSKIIVTCDADNTYTPRDIKKLLSKSESFDFVFASRVNKKYILPGARMGFVRRWANILISKLIQFGFKGPKLTDLGATFRLLNRNGYEKIKDHLSVGGIHFQPELTILALRNGLKVVEVPVHYGPRKGISKISGSLWGGIRNARKMVGIILYYYLMSKSEFLKNL